MGKKASHQAVKGQVTRLQGQQRNHLCQEPWSYNLFYNVVLLSFPLLLGAAIWSLRDRQRRLTDQTVELRVEREENARQAVFAERVRIARELHDVVAHYVSVIGVQAAGARRMMGRQPARAAEALSSIEASSREAVAELHRLLGFLRRAGDVDELAPQPRSEERRVGKEYGD